MKRIVNKAADHKAADEWDVKQQLSMTPRERMRAAKELRDRFYGRDTKDVREWHRKQ